MDVWLYGLIFLSEFYTSSYNKSVIFAQLCSVSTRQFRQYVLAGGGGAAPTPTLIPTAPRLSLSAVPQPPVWTGDSHAHMQDGNSFMWL